MSTAGGDGAESRNLNGAVVPAVEAVAVERRDDPHGSPFDFVAAIRPRIRAAVEGGRGIVLRCWEAIVIDSNSICAHLHFVAGKGDAWFEKRRSAIGARPLRCDIGG